MRRALGLVAGTILLAACASAPLHVAALDDMERARAVVSTQESGKVAAEVYAHAERERRIALEAHRRGDDVLAGLHAERAVAAYQHAVVVARFARAAAEQADAQKAFDDASTKEQAVETSRATLEADAQALEQRLRVARDRLLPAPSATATADREAARLVAARAMAVQARMLCDAAKLVAAGAEGLADANADAAKVDEPLARGAHPVPIDAAARARARCLDVLTRARRTAGGDVVAADALLADLSGGGWSPVRDERGVVVTLHDAFRGAELAPEGARRLQDLGKVAAAHAGFALQVVVHDATAPAAKDTTDAKRADAAVQALVAAGAPQGRVQTELAGARAPLVDPGDAKAGPRNERLDVVFIATGR